MSNTIEFSLECKKEAKDAEFLKYKFLASNFSNKSST